MKGPSIAVLGATGNVGEALLARLSSSVLAGGDVAAYASRATRRESVDFGGRTLPVRTLAEAADSGATLVFCALPPALAQRTVPSFAARGALVIDVGNSCSGLFAGPLCLPDVRPIDEAAVSRAGGARTPGAVGWMLTTVLAPLLPLGAWGITGLVNLPVTSYGRLATEEFSEQVVASFNSKDPPRRRFPDGVAFDTLPEDVDAGEWSDRERGAAAEVSELLGVNPGRIGVQFCTQPVFTGMTAALHIRGVDDVEPAETALREALGLATAARMRSLRPRKVMTRASVYFGGVRADPAGDGIHVWLAADNVSGAGAAVPVLLAERLLGAGVASGIDA
jgi:aspartate-semialdehyde dehydrogenase